MSWPFKNIGPVGAITLFGLAWLTLTLVFDCLFVWPVYRQLRTLHYRATDGVIIGSTLRQRQCSDSRHGGMTTYSSAELRYKYRVAGKEYHGDRYRFGECESTDNRAQWIVREHPLGRKVVVHYDAKDPGCSLLSPGLNGSDLFYAMFMLPFNLIAVGMLAFVGRKALGRLFPCRGVGAKCWDDGISVRVRLPQVPALLLAGVVVAGAAFAAIFAIAVLFDGRAPLWLMYRVWSVVLTSALLVYLGVKWRQSRGGYDLVIDTIKGTVSLPRGWGRKRKVAMSLHELTSLEVRSEGLPGSQDGFFSAYCPTMVFTDENAISRPQTLVRWSDRRRAEALVAWLRQRLTS
ncbi:MAG: DUF3592 domain-containing protein [Planctomycetaceae bacterium]|nr:DUF3592 domain-containing protein [Planctomycetaceae bacterium]